MLINMSLLEFTHSLHDVVQQDGVHGTIDTHGHCQFSIAAFKMREHHIQNPPASSTASLHLIARGRSSSLP